MTIWKFRLVATDQQTLALPEGAKILCVQAQRGQPHLWVLCDKSAPPVKRYIETFGTGHGVPEGDRRYIGTYQLEGGALVFHVFERLTDSW